MTAGLIAGFLSGVIGSMGMGGGAVLLIYLAVFAGVEQFRAQGINLIFFIPIGLISVAIYAFKKQIKWKTVGVFALFGLAGAAAGTYLSGLIGSGWTGKLFGGMLVLLGIKELFKKKEEGHKGVEKHGRA